MLKWIPINLTRARKQELSTNSLRKSQHIKCSHHICFVNLTVKDHNSQIFKQVFRNKNILNLRKKGYNGLDGIIFIMNRGSGASKVIDLINLQQNRLNDVVSNELKPRVPKMMNQIIFPPREEIVNHDDLIASINQLINQMATNEPGPTGDHKPQSAPSDSDWDSPGFGAKTTSSMELKRLPLLVSC